MDPRFNELMNHPANRVFNIVFFPDRIYHAQYLNATRSVRYRYDVHEVRGKADINVLKGRVFMDGLELCPFIRIEYKSNRLVEVAREAGRFVQGALLCELAVLPPGRPDVEQNYVNATVKLIYCPWIDSYQVELWQTLHPLAGRRHDFQVLDMMGHDGSIIRVPQMHDLLNDIKDLEVMKLRFRENDRAVPSGFTITDPQYDNYYQRNIQVPNTQDPSSDQNTVRQDAYTVNFRRGWYMENVNDIAPVRYRNAMMNDNDPERHDDNIVEMRWALQQEFGGSTVFFHEVTVPPGKVEGTHQHIGSEELYYITEGQGIAYMGRNDAPESVMEQFTPTTRQIFGIGEKQVYEVPVKPGSMIFTKSGGIHGIQNKDGTKPLKFVAFLYHSS